MIHSTTYFTIHADGGARGNPGPAATGFVIRKNNQILVKQGQTIGTTTNNVAEYQAVIAALKWLKRYLKSSPPNLILNVYLDSNLVVNQLSGRYKIKVPHLQPLARTIFKLKDSLHAQIFFHHISRTQNREADALVNQALDSVS